MCYCRWTCLTAAVGSKWPTDLLPSAGEKILNAALQAGPLIIFFWFVCFVSWTSSSLLTLLILWPSSPLPLCSPLVTVTVTVCLLPTFRVSPLMCCCSLALLNWHVRTFARVKSQLKWTAAENAVCYLFYFFFSTPHPPLCRPCCLWFPSRCTCDPFSFKIK